MFILVAIFFGIFYFMIIRPQRKQEATIKKFIDGLQKGDEVVSNSGLIGKIDKVLDGGVVVLEIANNVRVRVMKSQIAGPFAPAVEGDKTEKTDKQDADKGDKK